MQREVKKPENVPVQGGFPNKPLDDFFQRHVDRLIFALSDTDMSYRPEAEKKLAKFGEAAVPALIGVLKSKNYPARVGAANALEGMDVSVVPKLLDALEDRDEYVRWTIAGAIEKIIGKNPRHDWNYAIPVLVKALGDENENVRACSFRALVKSGPPALYALVVALGEGNEHVQNGAFGALEEASRDYPKDMVSAIARYVNGDRGDALLVTDSRTGEFFGKLDDLMFRCGKRMQDAA